MSSFLIGLFIGVIGIAYLFFMKNPTDDSGESDEMFDLRSKRGKSDSDKTTSGSNIRRK